VAATAACGTGSEVTRTEPHLPTHGSTELETLARRFAPVLRLHADEPYGIADVVAVFHPSRPLIGYHVFFVNDVVRPHDGERFDHEIVWVEYDAVSLKVADVSTYWHRTVLRTRACIAEAQSSSQRPIVDVQWGQHGMLPLGWEALRTTRPHLELRLNYSMVHRSERSVFPTHESPVVFDGTYDDYVRFTEPVELAGFVDRNSVAVAGRPQDVLEGRIAAVFARKKNWPYQ
jgi:hypothetical protein